MSQILQSLLITAIGMGLVFILILLLWALMAAIVTITNRYDFMAQTEESEVSEIQEESSPSGNKAGIVALAVATAITMGQKAVHTARLQSTNTSNWQAVTRANSLAQISSISNRKPRG